MPRPENSSDRRSAPRCLIVPPWVLLVLAAALPLHIPPALAAMPARPHADSLAPAFRLPDLTGTTLALEEALGDRLTIIVFWATWGKDSARVLEEMESLYRTYREHGLAVIGVCVDSQRATADERQRIADSVRRKGLTFPIAFDEGLKTFHAYGVIAVPTTIALNPARRILFRLSGYPIVGRENIRTLVVHHCGATPPATVSTVRRHTPGKETLRLYGMARVNRERGLNDLALKYAERARDQDSLYAEPLLLIAEIAGEARRIDEADSLCAVALRLEPALPAATRLRGFLLTRQGKTREAAALLSALLESDSGSSVTYAYLGYALGMGGNESEALRAFAKADSLTPSDARILLLQAEVYGHLGKQREAAAIRAKAKRRIRPGQ